jgi:hypothetical protein
LEVVMTIRTALVLGFAALPLAAGAEETRAGTTTEKTAVYMQAGYSSGSWDMGGAALGGLLVRDLGSRWALEASAAYLGHGMGSNGLSASAALLFNLRPSGEKAVPYLAAGGGLYRASFDMGNGRFSGAMNMGGSMMNGFGMMGLGSAPGAAWDYGQMPHFYGRRLANGTGTRMPYSGDRSFTDPAFSLGGGIRIDLGSRLYLRPDARALVVTSGGDTNTIGVFTLNLGYRF